MTVTFVLVYRKGMEVVRVTVRLVFVNCLGCLNLGSTVKLPEAQPNDEDERPKWLENENFILSRYQRFHQMLEGTRLV